MDNQEFLKELQRVLVPSEYRSCLNSRVPDGHALFKKWLYVFLAMPFDSVPRGDYGNDHARQIVRKAVWCSHVLPKRGLFLLYYGRRNEWEDVYENFRVDTTGFHPVIVQAIHFVDPEDGRAENMRTHWGPLKFGFCSGVIERIGVICDRCRG